MSGYPNPQRTQARHGTISGYNRHMDKGENPCDSCAQAKSAYDVRRRAAGQNLVKSRLRARAQGYAERDLRHNHLEEYRELYEKYVDQLLDEI